jgi:hypothetical protein
MNYSLILGLLACAAIESCQSVQKTIPKEFCGIWVACHSKITVRDKNPEGSGFRFTTDTARIIIKMDSGTNIQGHIGMAPFHTRQINANIGLPHSVTGISHIIKCGTVSRIFKTDPLPSKIIELWIKPGNHSDTLKAELRCKQYFDTFPMGDITFIKQKN